MTSSLIFSILVPGLLTPFQKHYMSMDTAVEARFENLTCETDRDLVSYTAM